jgi:ankyrin repeat protein
MPVDTDLHKAAHQGDLSSVAELLEDPEIDVNAKGAANRTPIHRACGGNHVKVIEMLLDKGADINAKDKTGRSPIHWAVIAGHTDALKFILGKGADVNAKTGSGMTPLHAAADGHLGCVTALLEYHADQTEGKITSAALDVQCKDGDGKSAMEIAKNGKHKEVEKLFKEKLGGGDATSAACIIM